MIILKRILIVVVIIFSPLYLFAQGKTTGISIISNPPGAEAILKGDLTIAGVTPVHFQQNLEGTYCLLIKRYGYETYKSKVNLQFGKPMSFNVNLKPRTKFKAIARSLFIPGWGQIYAEQKFKGGVLFLLSAGTSLYYFGANSDFKDKRDNYTDLEREYVLANTIEEKQRFFPLLKVARKEAYDAETVRRITIGATAAAWALNILDLLFYFPDHDSRILVNSLAVEPDIEQGGGKLVFTHRF